MTGFSAGVVTPSLWPGDWWVCCGSRRNRNQPVVETENDPGLFGVDLGVDFGGLPVGETLCDSPLVVPPMGRLVVTLAAPTNPPFSTVAKTPATAES